MNRDIVIIILIIVLIFDRLFLFNEIKDLENRIKTLEFIAFNK